MMAISDGFVEEHAHTNTVYCIDNAHHKNEVDIFVTSESSTTCIYIQYESITNIWTYSRKTVKQLSTNSI